MINDFEGVLFLDSDTDDDRADNRASRFHSFMHSSFVFNDDDFEVGLLEIQIPYTWKNMCSDQYVGGFDGVANTEIHMIERGCYYNIVDLVDAINRLFDNQTNPPRLIYDPHFGRIRSKAGSHKGCDNVHIRATRGLAAMLGFTNTWFEFQVIPPVRADGMRLMEYERKGAWTSSPFVLADAPVNLQAACERFFISSSIVKHRAHAQHELLRAIPLDRSKLFGDIEVIRFNRPIFVPIAHQTFDRIEICIRDRLGKEPEFTRGNVIVALEFRRRRDGGFLS